MKTEPQTPQKEQMSYALKPNNNVTFNSLNASEISKGSNNMIKPSAEYENNVNNLLEMSERIQEEREGQKSILMDPNQESQLKSDSQINHPEITEQMNNTQVQNNIKTLERLWEFRYTRLADYALKTNDWFKVFAFLQQFKEKSIQVVQDIIEKGIENVKGIDEIDYRYNLKNHGEEGIFFVDGIIVRIAKIKVKKDEPNAFDYNAVKAIHQEMISYNIINNLSISLAKDLPNLPRVRVPLTCMVKYLGYTALCQADPPCEGLETLVHGPTGTIYQYREEYMSILRIIGRSLNLKEFTMLSSDRKSVTIPFSLTVELHRINKQLKHQRLVQLIHPDSILYPENGTSLLKHPEFYLMNISKLWPLFIDSDIIKSVGYLRPEIVISSKAPLSNVVFCEVSEKPDPEGELELADSCKKVKEDHIFNLAKMLDNTTIFLVDSQGIEDIMHQYGINIRYIGSLAEKVNLDFNKKILETEMIARVCKRYFFKTFHQIVEEHRLTKNSLLTQFKQCFIDFLNLLFIKSKESEQFYLKNIYFEIRRYYDYTIKEFPPEVPGGGILHALCYHFGVKIKIIDYPFFQALDNFFNVAHILEIHGSAKTFDLDTSEIKQICKKYKEKRKQKKVDECIKELKILATINSLLNSEKTFPIAPLPEAYFWTELSDLHFRMGEVENAVKYAELALKGIPEKHSDAIRPFQILLKCHSVRKEMNKSVEYYEKSLNFLGYHLGTNHPLTISVYNSLAYEILETTDPTKCEKMFLKSLQICERSLGYTHATSSQILLQLAQLPLPAEKKINYYLQGLNVLENLDAGEIDPEKSKKTCMRIAEIYYDLGNLEKMIFYAKKSNHWRMQILGESKLGQHKSVLVLSNRVAIDNNELSFLIKHGFNSYVKLLERIPRDNLYKLFVSIKESIPPFKSSVEQTFNRLKIDKISSMTVTQFLRMTFNTVILEIPSLLQKPNFYRKIFSEIETNQRKVKAAIEAYMDIASIVGIENCDKILTQFDRRN